MKRINRPGTGCKTLLSVALAIGTLGAQAVAGSHAITLIEMGDLHGTLVPHAAVLKNIDGTERNVASAGGLARLKTVVDDIRSDNPEAVLLSAGDLTHGSAEAMFTLGDAMMVPMNAFGIDVYTPGNWDFGYGGAVFRNRFTTFGPKPTIPGNQRAMTGHISCADVPVIAGLTDEASGYSCTEITATAPQPTPEGKGVIKANFPAVAANLYNAAPLPPQLHGKPVLPAFKMLKRNGINIAVIGITASIVPQQADAFNIGLRFTQGVEELPGLIDQVKAQGAELIVVQPELGLSQNIKIAQSFESIDVMYSAHTHEVTLGALLVTKKEVIRTTPGVALNANQRRLLAKGAVIVVETNRDMDVSSRVYDIVHSMMPRLRPSILDNLGLVEALKDEIEAWKSRNIETCCKFNYSAELQEPGEYTSITLYRIVQECLTNISKHADAKNVSIELLKNAENLLLKVVDDGIGFNLQALNKGLGLIGMRERVNSLEGTMLLDSAPAKDVSIIITVPLTVKPELI